MPGCRCGARVDGAEWSGRLRPQQVRVAHGSHAGGLAVGNIRAMSITAPQTGRSKTPGLRGGPYSGELAFGAMTSGGVASLRLGPRTDDEPYPIDIRYLRAFAELESAGRRLLTRVVDALDRHRLHLQMVATLFLAVGSLTAVVPATLSSLSGGSVSSWVVTVAVSISCFGFAVFALAELANLTLWRVSSPPMFRLIGFVSCRTGGSHPSLVYARGMYGTFARRWLHRQGLSATTRQTFDSMISEWEGTASELVRFALTVEQ